MSCINLCTLIFLTSWINIDNGFCKNQLWFEPHGKWTSDRSRSSKYHSIFIFHTNFDKFLASWINIDNGFGISKLWYNPQENWILERSRSNKYPSIFIFLTNLCMVDEFLVSWLVPTRNSWILLSNSVIFIFHKLFYYQHKFSNIGELNFLQRKIKITPVTVENWLTCLLLNGWCLNSCLYASSYMLYFSTYMQLE